MDENRAPSSAVGVTISLQSVLMGAASLILFLLGVSYTLWDRGHQQNDTAARETNMEQWKRIASLEAGAYDRTWQIRIQTERGDRLERQYQELEKRVEVLEREMRDLKRGKR